MNWKNLNKGKKFNVDTENFEFCKVKELEINKEYKLLGTFINNSEFGKQAVFIIDGKLVDMPNHVTEITETILNDDEMIDDINKGKIYFKTYTYTSKKYKKECYGIEFIERRNENEQGFIC